MEINGVGHSPSTTPTTPPSPPSSSSSSSSAPIVEEVPQVTVNGSPLDLSHLDEAKSDLSPLQVSRGIPPWRINGIRDLGYVVIVNENKFLMDQETVVDIIKHSAPSLTEEQIAHCALHVDDLIASYYNLESVVVEDGERAYVAPYRIATHMSRDTIAGWEKATRDIGIIPAIRVFANLYSAEYSVRDTGIPEMKLGTPNAYVNSRSVTDAICLTQMLNNPYNRGYPYAGRTGDMLHRLARFHPLDFLAAVATYTN